MAFISASSKAMSEAELRADYAQAKVFWKVRLGDACVYFPRRLKTAYIPYSALARAFLRIETTLSRVCCGPAEFNTYRLIFCEDTTEIAAVELDSEEKANRILSALKARGVTVGKPAA